MLILGIDPGTNYTGWGLIKRLSINSFQYIASGVITTSNTEELYLRLAKISNEIEKVIENFNPFLVAVEESLANKNPQSSIKLAHTRGAILAVLGKCNLQVLEIMPKTIKKTLTGNGNAEKAQVEHMVKILLPNCTIKRNDEADALAIAYTAGVYYSPSNKIV